MKTILVPTDFSKAADNAIAYAAEVAKLTKATIVLFHAFHVPVVATEVPVEVPIDELQKDCLEGLRKIEHRLHLQYGKGLAVQCVCRCGFAVDEINDYTSGHNTDLIVMGMQGGGYLTEKLIGSITTALMRKSKCPVLAIDKGVKFRSIKKIVLACDYEQTGDKRILKPLKELADLFKAHVYVLNVVAQPEPVQSCSEAASDFMKLEHSLGDTDHTFHCLQNDDVVKGINTFVKEGKMDMVVMIPRKHSLLETIFNERNTKKMAFHSTVPLLALH